MSSADRKPKAITSVAQIDSELEATFHELNELERQGQLDDAAQQRIDARMQHLLGKLEKQKKGHSSGMREQYMQQELLAASATTTMSSFLKKLAMSLIGLLCSGAGFMLGFRAMDDGYVKVGKYIAATYYRSNDPMQFYLSLCVMFAFGIVGLVLAIFSLFATGRAEAEIVAQMDSALHVRKSIRRLGLIVGVLFLVLLTLVSFR